LALLFAVRLLAPAGFMPSFEHGAVTIIACPDTGFETAAPAAMHHHGKARQHPPCPYAAASSLGALGSDFVALAGIVLIGAAVLFRFSSFFFERSAYLRPPSRGPPLPA
jgi:hypothetical protein